MENIFLMKIEIILLLMSISYIIYYILDKIKNKYFEIKNIVEPKQRKNRMKKIRLVSSNNENNNIKKKEIHREEREKEITEEEKRKVRELIKRARVNSSK
jgi:hypothetical protein